MLLSSQINQSRFQQRQFPKWKSYIEIYSDRQNARGQDHSIARYFSLISLVYSLGLTSRPVDFLKFACRQFSLEFQN